MREGGGRKREQKKLKLLMEKTYFGNLDKHLKGKWGTRKNETQR